MSLPIAIQSAVFYFLACTPCAQVRHRQKAKAEAKKEREEKAKLVLEQPGRYRHPSPFNTNPFWDEEIAMGPSLPKKAGSKNSSQRVLTSSGRDSDVPSMSESTNVADSRTNFGDSSTFVPGSDTGLSDDWNRKKGYQREDEELWGQWSGHKIMDAFSKAKDSAGRLFESRGSANAEREVTEQARRDFYFSPKNPPVNDYHPPVVSSKLPHKDAHRWMLQPPPPAKIMEGKMPVSRNLSSGSKSSGSTVPFEEPGHGGRVPSNFERERRRKDPTEEELIESLFMTRSDRSLSFHRTRSMSLDGVDETAEIAFERRQKARAKPVAAPPGAESDGDDDEDEVPAMQTARPLTGTTPRAAQRPRLETIVSTGSMRSLRGRSSSKVPQDTLKAEIAA